MIRWYRVPWDTPTVPYFHIYGTTDYEPVRPKSDPPLGVPGVLWSGTAYDKGAPPMFTGTNRRPCGSAAAWAGTTRAAAPSLVYDDFTNVSICCGVPPVPHGMLELVPAILAGGRMIDIGIDGPATAPSIAIWASITAEHGMAIYSPVVSGAEVFLIGDSVLPEGKVRLIPQGIYGGFLRLVSRVPSASVLDWTTTLAPAQQGVGILGHLNGTNLLAVRSSAIPGGVLQLVHEPVPVRPEGKLRLVSWSTGGRIALGAEVVLSSGLALEGTTLPTQAVMVLKGDIPRLPEGVLSLHGGTVVTGHRVALASSPIPAGGVQWNYLDLAQGVFILEGVTVIAGSLVSVTTDIPPAVQLVTMVTATE